MTSPKDACTNIFVHNLSFGAAAVEKHKLQCDSGLDSKLPPAGATFCRQDEACMQVLVQIAWAIKSN